MYKQILTVIIVIITFIFLFHPDRHAKNYNYIDKNYIYEYLSESSEVIKNNELFCNVTDYKNLILTKQENEISFMKQTNSDFKNILPGGEFIPTKCNARFKSAIIVPYRNREEHLKIFLSYMHYFLKKQNIHYRIFLIEQSDTFPFNRGKLLNVGVRVANSRNFSCFFLHDVDLLPMNNGHIYACSHMPRHLASGMDTFRFHLPYYGFTGGVFSINYNQYTKINGMSNRFNGWGGEDDDFFMRLTKSDLKPCRFPPEYNKYHMLKHKKATPSENRWNELEASLVKIETDGYNTSPEKYKIITQKLYTHVLV